MRGRAHSTGREEAAPRISRDPADLDRAYRLLKPLLWSWFRPDVRGLDRVPRSPCLLVGNHNAAMLMPEMFVLGVALYERDGPEGVPFGLGHSLGLRLPGIRHALEPLGAVKGTPDLGLDLLRDGRRVLCYPGGELDSMRSSRERDKVVFGDRRGYVRLALRAAVPIVPVVTSGAHETLLVLSDGRRLARWLRLNERIGLKAWPLVLCLPWGLWLGVPPPHLPRRTRIVQEILEPVSFERVGEEAAADARYVEACHERVHATMEATLRRLCAERRTARRWP